MTGASPFATTAIAFGRRSTCRRRFGATLVIDRAVGPAAPAPPGAPDGAAFGAAGAKGPWQPQWASR